MLLIVNWAYVAYAYLWDVYVRSIGTKMSYP